MSSPSVATKHQVDWLAVAVVGGIHVLAATALLPWLFSWTGVALALLGCYVFGTLGINLGYHRLLSHRSFKCPVWVERTLALLGVCCLEKTPGQFVATHRAHHQFSDEDGDPHSPLKTLFWGHMGWLFVENSEFNNAATYDRYARDIYRDAFYMRLERNLLWLGVYVLHSVLFAAVGFGIGLGVGGSLGSGVQLGLGHLRDVGGRFQEMVRVRVRGQAPELEARLHEESRVLAVQVVEAWEAFVRASESGP